MHSIARVYYAVTVRGDSVFLLSFVKWTAGAGNASGPEHQRKELLMVPRTDSIREAIRRLDPQERHDLILELRLTSITLRSTAAKIDRMIDILAETPQLAPPRITPAYRGQQP